MKNRVGGTIFIIFVAACVSDYVKDETAMAILWGAALIATAIVLLPGERAIYSINVNTDEENERDRRRRDGY